MDPATRYRLRCNIASIMKISFDERGMTRKLLSTRLFVSGPDKKNLQSMLDTLRGSDVSDDDMHLTQEGKRCVRTKDHVITNSFADNLPYSVGGPHLGDESIESTFGLGELAGLTVANEADPLAFEVSFEPARPPCSLTLLCHR